MISGRAGPQVRARKFVALEAVGSSPIVRPSPPSQVFSVTKTARLLTIAAGLFFGRKTALRFRILQESPQKLMHHDWQTRARKGSPTP